MTTRMYQLSVPVFVLGLKNLAGLLKKADSYVTSKKIEASVLLQTRLYPDMLPLVRQVQIACDIVKGGAARLAGVEVPSYADTETTIAELEARIEKTIQFIESLKPEQIDGSETRTINLKMAGNPVTFEGLPYLLKFVLPNLHFHTSIAYAILRSSGVEIGKADFLGPIL